jgi:hypothetical protein
MPILTLPGLHPVDDRNTLKALLLYPNDEMAFGALVAHLTLLSVETNELPESFLSRALIRALAMSDKADDVFRAMQTRHMTGIIAGMVLLEVLLMVDAKVQEPSQRKAFATVSKRLQQGVEFKVSGERVRLPTYSHENIDKHHWPDFRSVAHFWTAIAITNDALQRAEEKGETLDEFPERIRNLEVNALGLAANAVWQEARQVPDATRGQHQQKMLLPASSMWLLPLNKMPPMVPPSRLARLEIWPRTAKGLRIITIRLLENG